MPFEDFSVVKEARKRKEKSLRASILDGMSYSVMLGFGEALIIPFALALNATDFQIGLLATAPIFLGMLTQLLSAKLLTIFRKRKPIILLFAAMQAITWLFIAMLPFVIKNDVVWILVAFYCAYFMFGQTTSPVWNSLMADLVSPKERGRFFGRRNSLTGFAALSATLAAGFFLNLYPQEFLLIGFSSMFIIAMIYRFISSAFLKKMHEPEYIWPEPKKQSLVGFLKKAPKTNIGLFALFVGMMNFSVFIAAPFFTPYMLENLGFNYLIFTIINSSAVFASIVVMRRWGQNSDAFGNIKVLGLASLLVSFLPLLWLFSPDPKYLILVQLFSGFAWAGFNLAAANFVYDAVEPSTIARYLSYQNTVVGAMVLAGGMVGSLIAEKAQFLAIPNYFAVFIASALLRLLVVSFFLPRISEVRTVPHISRHQLFFKMVTIRPMHGMVSEIMILPNRIAKAMAKGKKE